MKQDQQLLARLELALQLADEAGSRLLRTFQDPALRTEHKPDGTIVTAADRETEEIIRAGVARVFPGDGLLGEEGTEERGTSGWRWIVDPLDGTRSYVRGIPHFVTLIAVERGGEPLIGVAHAPALGEMLSAARGGGSWWTTRTGEQRAARVSRTADLAQAYVELGALASFRRAGCAEVHARLLPALKRTRGWSDGYAFMLVATGRVDAAINAGFSPWDLAPFLPILEEAGGRFTDWSGARTIERPNVVASNGLLHEALLRALGPAQPA
jgi:histidinol phosphatase-like enzyme (inositol monophosphatase family)